MNKKEQKWSYSRWSMYNQCPAQYEWHYILKKPRGTSPALERGIDIHKKAENFIKGIIKGLPKELKNFKKEFAALKREYKKSKGFTEPDISMNKDRTPSTKFETDWFIGFADFAHFDDELTVIDYKTGKKYPGHKEQGNIYSVILLLLNPDIDKVTVEFWYLDNDNPENNITDFVIHRKDVERFINVWERRINKMYADKRFEATPHKFCKGCKRNKKHGGDCDG